jgi:hypothetical protein
MWENAGAYATIGVFILNIILALSAAKIHSMIRENMDLLKKDIDTRIGNLHAKIIEFEMWTRDTFVRRDSFYVVRDELTKNIEKMSGKVEARLERMENKLDNIKDKQYNT